MHIADLERQLKEARANRQNALELMDMETCSIGFDPHVGHNEVPEFIPMRLAG